MRSSGRPVLRGVERSSATLVKEQRKVREREGDNEVLRAPKHSTPCERDLEVIVEQN